MTVHNSPFVGRDIGLTNSSI